jgi:parallel beta-helix repeat protein
VAPPPGSLTLRSPGSRSTGTRRISPRRRNAPTSSSKRSTTSRSTTPGRSTRTGTRSGSAAIGTALVTNVRITRNRITSSPSYIGIQVTQFDGIDISENTVTGSTDNGIDIYGDSGAGAPTGRNFRITNNRVTGGSVGIFVESSEKGLVTGNYLTGCTSAGVVVNRISSRPTDINIVANTISGGPVGVRVTGDMRGISIRNHVIAGVTTAGVQLGSGTGNSAYVWVLDNTIDTATQDTVPLVLLTGNQAAFIRIRGTITKNTNRGLDTANQATTSASVTISPANAA